MFVIHSSNWSYRPVRPRPHRPRQSKLGHVRATVNVLPDDALLDIFDIYANYEYARITDWHTLVLVCRRWRRIVLASPRHLKFRLEYTGKNLWKKTLDNWPDFLIVISDRDLPLQSAPEAARRWYQIVATLDSGYHDRILEVQLSHIPNSQLEAIPAAMQKPFPALTNLSLLVRSATDLVVPDSFLGGSGPRLRTVGLHRCSFPGMQRLLLSAKDLVTLSLDDIPHSGYISPNALVTALSVMTRLKSLALSFRSPQSRPDSEGQSPPPLTRTVLSGLTKLTFKGVHEYSESLMAQIDAPLLENLFLTFFMDLIFRVPQLYQLTSQIRAFKTLRHAKLYSEYDNIRLILSPSAQGRDWQLLSLAQVCTSSPSPISTVEDLHIAPRSRFPRRSSADDDDDDDDIELEENKQWLELPLGPFTAVRDLTIYPPLPLLQ